MELFKKALECALAHEKSKTAIRTRRHYKKQIDVLERTIVGLKSVIENKDSEMGIMGNTIEKLNLHLGNKKSEIAGLEGELHQVKSALEDKDKMHTMVLHKLTVQKIWRMLEENCYLNKRILELDLEVQSLEALVAKLRIDNEKIEHKATILGQNLKHSQDGYELKCREVIDISVSEQQLRATVFNLMGELDQWKRNAKWQSPTVTASPITVDMTNAAPFSPSVINSPQQSNSSTGSSSKSISSGLVPSLTKLALPVVPLTPVATFRGVVTSDTIPPTVRSAPCSPSSSPPESPSRSPVSGSPSSSPSESSPLTPASPNRNYGLSVPVSHTIPHSTSPSIASSLLPLPPKISPLLTPVPQKVYTMHLQPQVHHSHSRDDKVLDQGSPPT